MRTKNFLFTALLLSGFAFTSCDDNDDNYTPDGKIQEAFITKYPNAQRVEWEKKYDHYVADFYLEGIEREAWINAQGEWVMTESDIRYTDLPAEVQSAFQASEYKDWKIDDVDMLERVEMEPVYVIEVEQGKQEFDLYYAADGTLLKAVEDMDNNNEHHPTTVPEALKTAIDNRYPGAVILDIDVEKGITEIDIRHEGKSKEVHFNAQNEWLYTSWDVRQSEVPTEVMTTINNAISQNHKGYKIDDIEYEERPNGDVYVFELEKENDRDIYVTVDMEGNIVK
ncbi:MULTISPECIES: PepSY-like domain-containing protein [Butyricimonas]|jgi:hypothetical protein|uniref:PepSY-like domain-containing protein n=1 Tax=Butyricimonas hominis TaxID=2763032 RepID=A0ABR7CXK4_9BACT|nr:MULTISPECIES: PepSY-like domain-containing protein [Butyricimonas]MBC5620403.1 PepSY-like domain-containing protein [Butyricimonas hominis]